MEDIQDDEQESISHAVAPVVGNDAAQHAPSWKNPMAKKSKRLSGKSVADTAGQDVSVPDPVNLDAVYVLEGGTAPHELSPFVPPRRNWGRGSMPISATPDFFQILQVSAKAYENDDGPHDESLQHHATQNRNRGRSRDTSDTIGEDLHISKSQKLVAKTKLSTQSSATLGRSAAPPEYRLRSLKIESQRKCREAHVECSDASVAYVGDTQVHHVEDHAGDGQLTWAAASCADDLSCQQVTSAQNGSSLPLAEDSSRESSPFDRVFFGTEISTAAVPPPQTMLEAMPQEAVGAAPTHAREEQPKQKDPSNHEVGQLTPMHIEYATLANSMHSKQNASNDGNLLSARKSVVSDADSDVDYWRRQPKAMGTLDVRLDNIDARLEHIFTRLDPCVLNMKMLSVSEKPAQEENIEVSISDKKRGEELQKKVEELQKKVEELHEQLRLRQSNEDDDLFGGVVDTFARNSSGSLEDHAKELQELREQLQAKQEEVDEQISVISKLREKLLERDVRAKMMERKYEKQLRDLEAKQQNDLQEHSARITVAPVASVLDEDDIFSMDGGDESAEPGEQEARAHVNQEDEERQCTFYFLSRKFILGFEGMTLPDFHEMQECGQGALVTRTLHRSEAYLAKYKNEILAVSHRWESPAAPDSQGTQMSAIREYLDSDAGQPFKYIWFDFSCMPQGQKRTQAEKIKFKWMLGNVNLLYVGASVLILADISYLSRFWTQFEAWLSMQQGSSKGLQAAPDHRRRCSIKCIHNATLGNEDRKLIEMWSIRSPEEAIKVLAAPDVVVTNAKDKHEQLGRILALNEETVEAHKGLNLEVMVDAGVSVQELLEHGYRVPELQKEGFSVTKLIQAGYTPPELKELGFKAIHLGEAGVASAAFTVAELKSQGVNDALKLRKWGYTAKDLRSANFSAKRLLEVGYSPLDLLKAGFPAKDLKARNVGVTKLKNLGATAIELKKVGFDSYELVAAGFQETDLTGAGYIGARQPVREEPEMTRSRSESQSPMRGSASPVRARSKTVESVLRFEISGVQEKPQSKQRQTISELPSRKSSAASVQHSEERDVNETAKHEIASNDEEDVGRGSLMSINSPTVSDIQSDFGCNPNSVQQTNEASIRDTVYWNQQGSQSRQQIAMSPQLQQQQVNIQTKKRQTMPNSPHRQTSSSFQQPSQHRRQARTPPKDGLGAALEKDAIMNCRGNVSTPMKSEIPDDLFSDSFEQQYSTSVKKRQTTGGNPSQPSSSFQQLAQQRRQARTPPKDRFGAGGIYSSMRA